MAYSKLTWKDGAAGGTPLNAANLNRMEDGIEEAVNALGDIDEALEVILGE